MEKHRGDFFYGWIILAVGVGVVFGALGLARFGYTLVLPSMQRGLDIANTQAGALATANLVGYLLLSLAGGALATRFGPRMVISAGLALAGFGMLMTGFAQGFLMVAFWRGLTGVGSGASNVPVMGLLSSWFSRRKRGFAAGIAVSGSSVGLILLGLTVPRLLEIFGDSGWRICWFLFGGVTLLIAVGAVILLRNHPSEKGTKAHGEDYTAPSGPGNPSSAPPGLGSVYTSPAVWFMGLIYVAFGFSYIIYVTFFFKHLITEGGYTREAAGNLFMLIGWLSLFCGVIWGSVSDRLGRKYTLAIVYALQAVSFGLFALWTEPPGFLLSAVLFGLTAWSIPAIMAAACGDVLGAKLAPAALGFITLFFGIGQAVGPSVAGAIADAAGTFDPAFLLAGIVALLGAVGSLFLKT
jgi:MFS family permease